ncbi:MAG: YggS family pyridoxal phosphate-dependent enzyme [Candidatus Aceula lacicola]|nr:YggS family pyridoxal phosphate-dependent enzyme [Candidatus Aceula lacicola]
MSMIRDNILRLKDNISLICKRLGRNSDEITLLAVTKYVSVEEVKEALDAGIVDVGENKVQEGCVKYKAPEISVFEITKHMIGHLQTNKVKLALEAFDIIQSVDSFRIAQEIEKNLAKLNKKTRILVQVNTSGEEQKFGIPESDAILLIEKISNLKNIEIQGLMTMAPWTDNKDIVRDCFKRLNNLKREVSRKFCDTSSVQMKFLSMGMSHDYEIALEEGSNMVRIGQAIFS